MRDVECHAHCVSAVEEAVSSFHLFFFSPCFVCQNMLTALQSAEMCAQVSFSFCVFTVFRDFGLWQLFFFTFSKRLFFVNLLLLLCIHCC